MSVDGRTRCAHTQHTRGLHTVSVSQSERGNLVFSFRECVYYLHRCVLFTAHLVRRLFMIVGHALLLLSIRKPLRVAGPRHHDADRQRFC